MQAQWSAHAPPRATSLGRLRLGPNATPKEFLLEFRTSVGSRVYKLRRVRSAGVSPTHHKFHITPTTVHATSVGIPFRAGHPPAPRGLQSRSSASTRCRAASRSHGRGLGTRIISGLYRISYRNSSYMPITLSRATHLHQPPQPVQLHQPPQPEQLHQPPQPVHLHRPPQPVQLHVCYCVTACAIASGHAIGSRPPFAYIRTCTRVRVHPH